MQNRFDFWRALGISFAGMSISVVVALITFTWWENSLPFYTFLHVGGGLALSIGLTWFYFYKTAIQPSGLRGLYFGLVTFLVFFVLGIFKLFFEVVDAEIPTHTKVLLPHWLPVVWGSIVLTLGANYLTGFLLNKYK